MTFRPLPRDTARVIVPPIKCQGIKTKLVGFILRSIYWTGNGRWIEPFAGSGVVLFNIQPERALVNDVNPHIIRLYERIQRGEITTGLVRQHLTREARKLVESNGEYYYEVRERFNETGDSLDFLFLNRSCFNGVMRFNRRGEFNVPFCRKPERFSPAYVSKITNQVAAIARSMYGKEWHYKVGDWRDCLAEVREDDFVYLDPPYIGRHTDYYSQWSESDAIDLARVARELPCGVALSMWKQNKYRSNEHISAYWDWAIELTMEHFYYVGSRETLRNSMTEALLVKPGYTARYGGAERKQPRQLTLMGM